VSRSCHCVERRRPPQDPEVIRRLLHDGAYASLAREGLARTTTDDATVSWPSDRRSPSRQTPSTVRSSRSIDIRSVAPSGPTCLSGNTHGTGRRPCSMADRAKPQSVCF
jgi:hypothetical protein